MNPESRLIKSKEESVAESLEKLRVEIRRSLGKTSIQSIKQKMKKNKAQEGKLKSFGELVLKEDEKVSEDREDV